MDLQIQTHTQIKTHQYTTTVPSQGYHQPYGTPTPNVAWQPQGYQQPYATPPDPNGARQYQSYQQPHGTPDPNGAWQPQGPQPLNRDQQRAAARKVLLQCGNCSRIGYELKRCVGPVNGFGFIDGCPMCNTADHVLFECAKAWKSDGNQRHMLMFGRNQKPMLSWPSDLTEHPVWRAISADTKPEIWTPSFALQTWQEDPPIAEDPAWGNPSLMINLKDRSERGLARNASGFGCRPQSQPPPPSAQYFPPPMMPQLLSFPPPPPPPQPKSPDTFSVTGIDNFTKFTQNLMNLAPAGGKNGRGRKESAIKGASNAKVKDRSQSPKAQTKTRTYRERSSLRTSDVKLADRMTFPDPTWVTDRRTSELIGIDENAASDHFSDNEDVRSDIDEAPEDAASAAKATEKTLRNRKSRARAKAKRHAIKAKEDADFTIAAAEQDNVDKDAEAVPMNSL
ncbi:hypothetical protein BOTCAL_0404g00050 [Botryotinia calthae]|uniref:Uncharacterized protein n=1 Tax=Botryotinia calthae TaxID=38488 RepID=A0A4Y8CPZ8_9HELO|nr:hypothetical protein BOTCAL_0404g00050 [Botryotinia calthae]